MFAAKHIAENIEPCEAIRALSAIDAVLPGKFYLQFYLGLSHLKCGDPKTGLAHFRNALEMNPHQQEIPSIYSYMGTALKDIGRFDQALEALRKGAAIDPERTDIHNLIGFCHFKRREHDLAVASFLRVIALDPTSAIDYANLGVNYQALGDTDKAVQCYRTALMLDPDITFARVNLAGLTQ
jgi:ribosomal protein S12 methylthiotransferase accessory factor